MKMNVVIGLKWDLYRSAVYTGWNDVTYLWS